MTAATVTYTPSASLNHHSTALRPANSLAAFQYCGDIRNSKCMLRTLQHRAMPPTAYPMPVGRWPAVSGNCWGTMPLLPLLPHHCRHQPPRCCQHQVSPRVLRGRAAPGAPARSVCTQRVVSCKHCTGRIPAMAQLLLPVAAAGATSSAVQMVNMRSCLQNLVAACGTACRWHECAQQAWKPLFRCPACPTSAFAHCWDLTGEQPACQAQVMMYNTRNSTNQWRLTSSSTPTCTNLTTTQHHTVTWLSVCWVHGSLVVVVRALGCDDAQQLARLEQGGVHVNAAVELDDELS
ncbi:hypothetical protein COO60DRAFT_160194 [Scenedesmus sp. NREL 46B-D3]|nr:hypothetical protein COO60DRAFT_160194 [Scenedesmus sp. NREL 46B-D3]